MLDTRNAARSHMAAQVLPCLHLSKVTVHNYKPYIRQCAWPCLQGTFIALPLRCRLPVSARRHGEQDGVLRQPAGRRAPLGGGGPVRQVRPHQVQIPWIPICDVQN